MQRLEQMHIVPDVLQAIDPIASILLFFGTPKRPTPSGDFVNSLISASAPSLKIQSFDKHPRTITVAVIDPDVPNLAQDSFDYHCHFLATNIPLTATSPNVDLAALSPAQVILPWLPPHAQKGSPYHRLSVFVLEQAGELDAEAVKLSARRRLGFNIRSFNDKHSLKVVGAQLFRTQWDQNTARVMKDAGLEGADVEYVRKKPESLPWSYKVKDGARYR
jgi:large subunit ribosomal protein L35